MVEWRWKGSAGAWPELLAGFQGHSAVKSRRRERGRILSFSPRLVGPLWPIRHVLIFLFFFFFFFNFFQKKMEKLLCPLLIMGIFQNVLSFKKLVFTFSPP